MFTPLQHTSLIVGVFDLLHLHHLGLLQHLDGIEALVVLALYQMHAAKAARAQRAADLEVLERVFAFGLADGVAVGLLGGKIELGDVVAVDAATVGRVVLTALVVGLVDEVFDGGHILRVGAGRHALRLVHCRLGSGVGARRSGAAVGGGGGFGLGEEVAGLGQDGGDGRGGEVRGRPLRVLGAFLLEEAERRHHRGGGALQWEGGGV